MTVQQRNVDSIYYQIKKSATSLDALTFSRLNALMQEPY